MKKKTRDEISRLGMYARDLINPPCDMIIIFTVTRHLLFGFIDVLSEAKEIPTSRTKINVLFSGWLSCRTIKMQARY